MIYVDSNYWIYWLDSRLPEHHRASLAMRKAVTGEIVMNYVTLAEVGHYLRMLPRDEFSEKIESILNLSTLSFVDLDDAIARSAMGLLPRYSARGLGSRDCIIIATMRRRGLREILTHDRAFSRVEGFRVIDPIVER